MVIIAYGVESMSRVPMGSDGGALFDPFMQRRHGGVPQGISADLLATLNGFDRSDVDAFAVQSQQKAAQAIKQGHFTRSIVPIVDKNGLTILDRDEHPRPETTMETLSALKPSFAMMGETFGLDALTRKRYPQVERIRHVHHAIHLASWMAPRRCWSVPQMRQGPLVAAKGPHPCHGPVWL